MARSLKGGPLEHLKHYKAASDALDRAMDDENAAVTCRRRFEALQRASEAYGELEEEFSYMDDREQLRVAKTTDMDGEWVWGETEEFIEKCGR